MSDAPTQSLPRRRFRVSVRALMVIVLILGAGPCWLVRVIYQTRQQREAVEAIEQAGGLALYDWQWPRTGSHAPSPPGPNWVHANLGIDMVSSVVFVDLRGTATDRLAAMAGRLPRLEELHCGGLRGGLRLELRLTPRALSFYPYLHPDDYSFWNTSLGHLRGLVRLRVLDLSYSEISDEGLPHLAGLTSLMRLDLSQTEVSDAGLAHLAGLTNLRALNLEGTRVTAAGLKRLAGLRGLRFLDVRWTGVDDFGAQELRRAFPKAKVEFTGIVAR